MLNAVCVFYQDIIYQLIRAVRIQNTIECTLTFIRCVPHTISRGLVNNAKKLCEEAKELQNDEKRLRAVLFDIQQQHKSKVTHIDYVAQETTEASQRAQQKTDEMEAKVAKMTTAFNPNDYEDEMSNGPKIKLLDGSCLSDRLREIMEDG